MIKRTFAALVVTTMMLTLTQQTIAQAVLVSNTKTTPETWTLLGTRTIDTTSDSVVIVVADSGSHFTSLKVTVLNGSLDMEKCTVHFSDGATTDVDLTSRGNSDLAKTHKENAKKEHTETGKEHAKIEHTETGKEHAKSGNQVFELADNTKSIEKVTFWYDSKNKENSGNRSYNSSSNSSNSSSNTNNSNNSNNSNKAVVELWGNK